MHIRRLILFIAVAAAVLAACGGAPALQSSSPTAAPAANVSAPTAMIAPTPATASTVPVSTVNDHPNDATQARLRVDQCVFNGPNIDVFVNGAVAVNGGVALKEIPTDDVSGYLYLTPGTYSIAVVPSGKAIAQALIGPLDVPLAAGHRYTVVTLGQVGDTNHTPLVIDETAAYQAVGVTPSSAAHITINNMKGLPGIDFIEDGTVREKDVPYGGFKAAVWPVGNAKGLAITVSDAPKQVIDDRDGGVLLNIPGFIPPGSDSLDCIGGTYPGTKQQDYGANTSPSTSTLNVIDFMKGYSGKHVTSGGSNVSFDTFLAALKTTGLTDVFATGGPYALLVPTDDAFTAMPKAQRDALMANPKALADVLRTHISQGYYPSYSFSKKPGEPWDRTITNLLGAKLVLGDGTINGAAVGDIGSTFVANGVRVSPITRVVLPAKK